MRIQPYLFFNGECEEALAFYESALGAKRGATMRFSDSPDQPPPGMIPPDWGPKIMHADFKVGETEILASDGCDADPKSRGGFSLALSVKDASEADRAFKALAESGEVTMPLGETFFSSRFGAVKDRFGVSWMIVAPAPQG